MKLHVLSDLHLEFCDYKPSALAQDADAVVLAGDLCPGTAGIAWAANTFPGKTVIYVPGNHEYYHEDLVAWHSEADALKTSFPNVHVLQADSLLLANGDGAPVRVLGATLWTDFELYGSNRREFVAKKVENALMDYRAIKLNKQQLRWRDTLEIHQGHRAWLLSQARAARSRGEKVVVVTHHAPSLRSSAPVYVNDLVTAGFASNLESFASEHVDVWVHGHMHNSSVYSLGQCLVVCNPRGYPRTHRAHLDNVQFENPRFNPDLILTLK